MPEKKLVQIVCRNVELGVWRRARSQAVLQDLKMGNVLTTLLEKWLQGNIRIQKGE
jgi:hypothetical protein